MICKNRKARRSATRPTTATRDAGRRHRLAALGVVGLLSLMVACGQKGGNDTTPAKQQSSTTTGNAVATTSATSARSASTLAPGTTGVPHTSGSTTHTSSKGSSSATTVVPKPSDPRYADFCGAFAVFLNEISALPLGADSMEQYIKIVSEKLQPLADAAPDAIKADMEAVATAYKNATPGDLATLESDPALKSATDRINAWMVTNCGFSPD